MESEIFQQKVALVSGGNRGIGMEICRQLARQKNVTVLLTARDHQKGEIAVKKLNQNNIVSFQLNVNDKNGIQHLKKIIDKEFGRLDILINNAAIFKKDDRDGLKVNAHVVRDTLETNLIGPLTLCQTFLPMMQTNNYGRVVNVSSSMGELHSMGGGYPAYRISKTALNALTRILAAEVQGYNILINTMCPGWVRTDMGGPNATRSVKEGADTAVWLALLPDGAPSGKFFRDRKQIDW